ncbi:MAG: hypothetical protein LBG88_03220 [Christensenellaceae bacterium]|jgi:hypothetical protein|nr:hypothetical protein [Christensenellaceae bacterium]
MENKELWDTLSTYIRDTESQNKKAMKKFAVIPEWDCKTAFLQGKAITLYEVGNKMSRLNGDVTKLRKYITREQRQNGRVYRRYSKKHSVTDPVKTGLISSGLTLKNIQAIIGEN